MLAASVDELTAAALRDYWTSRLDPRPREPREQEVIATQVRMLLRAFPVAPLPGSGRTWQRFEALTALGALDLSVARLVEAHLDAVAILAELDVAAGSRPGEVWGVWASEPPNARVEAERARGGRWHVSGRKAWCSGAGVCSHALVTAQAPDGPRLFAVSMEAAGTRLNPSEWAAGALAGSDTRSVDFDEVSALPVGDPGQYVARPGFWHGAIGVAAVWHGGAVGVGRRLLAAGRRGDIGEIGRVHLGGVGAALAGARSALRDAAGAIDADPYDALEGAAVRAQAVRAVVEASSLDVISRVNRALGPGPLATDAEHLGRIGDLTLYLRQSHAERDLADLGTRLIGSGEIW
jgi:alkylation response protein AidB-like acyl-CoA dehydrogenase